MRLHIKVKKKHEIAYKRKKLMKVPGSKNKLNLIRLCLSQSYLLYNPVIQI